MHVFEWECSHSFVMKSNCNPLILNCSENSVSAMIKNLNYQATLHCHHAVWKTKTEGKNKQNNIYLLKYINKEQQTSSIQKQLNFAKFKTIDEGTVNR